MPAVFPPKLIIFGSLVSRKKSTDEKVKKSFCLFDSKRYTYFELRNSLIVIPACQQAEPESRFYLNFLDSRLGRE